MYGDSRQPDSVDEIAEIGVLERERRAWQAKRAAGEVHLWSTRSERDAALAAQVDELDRRLGTSLDTPVCEELRILRSRVRTLEGQVAALLEWWERAE